MSNKSKNHLMMQIEYVENGYVLLVSFAGWNSGMPADKYVFNDIEDMNNFLTDLTGDMQ